ncbi:MAG: DUF1338 domain-containing protein [Planctomycetes bacterium]|nr:DUF1338 domain-containing protein [Planctomycetota bacterium]
MTTPSAIQGPHQQIPMTSASEAFLSQLLDRLWDRYRQRVAYVQAYEKVVSESGATFVNDHIAFRTIACQHPLTGICTLSRIFEALGYRAAGCYHFEDKQLSAIHFQHPNGKFPKLFISELKVWELNEILQAMILKSVRTHRLPISEESLTKILRCELLGENEREQLLQLVLNEFHELPWNLPEKFEVEAVNRVSQYAAWVLVHGYNVNHFTSLINSHGVPALQDIDRTVAALRNVAVPMKAEIEGAVGSKLRQTATEAVVIDVDISKFGVRTTMPWTYAYFELAERGEVIDPETGNRARFEGFLGPQATQLFEMTRLSR